MALESTFVQFKIGTVGTDTQDRTVDGGCDLDAIGNGLGGLFRFLEIQTLHRYGKVFEDAGLAGNLLMIHGTADDNVQYQSSEQLVDKLIALNKTFTFMMYPDRSHSIDEKENTRRHLFTLMTDYLHEHLPLQAAPEQ